MVIGIRNIDNIRYKAVIGIMPRESNNSAGRLTANQKTIEKHRKKYLICITEKKSIGRGYSAEMGCRNIKYLSGT